MKYEFNEKRHLHTLDGKALTGCTTVLSVVAKPFLIQWAANMAVDYIIEGIGRMRKDKTIKDFTELFEEARKAHCRKKEKAGDWGKGTHLLVESYIKEGKKDERIKLFIEWAESNKIKFLESEKNVYSEKLWIGGIVDFICEIDGKIWIGDLKTSKSGIYAENFWQCAGYDLMLNECSDYKDITGYLIINLKENGEFLEKRSASNEEHKKAFLACLEIYRQKEKTNNQII